MPPSVARRVSASLALALALAGCGAPARTSSPEVAAAADGDAAAPGRSAAPGPAACTTAACWRARADAARAAGVDDVAADHLGRAHALAGDEASLRAWIDALVASGRRRAAQRALTGLASAAEDPGRRAAFEAIARELPPAGEDAALTIPRHLPPALRQALALHAAGDREGARRAFEAALAAAPAPPQHRAQFGALLEALGEPAAARRARARARIDLEERGAAVELIAAETWRTEGVFWWGEQLALVHGWDPAEAGDGRHAQAITFWPASAGDRPIRRLVFPAAAQVTVAADDGRLLRGVGSELQIVDAESGAVLRRITARGGEIRGVDSVAAGDRRLLLLAAGAQGELWRDDGEHLGDLPLAGTTPTITRVYRGGRRAIHDNILEDTPTWPVSLALARDGDALAIGGSDSKVRLVTRGPAGARERVLAYAWRYVERRPMGGNPDLNPPLAMRFVDDGAALLVAYAHGDVIRWRTRDGAVERHSPGACSDAEATAVVNRHQGPGDPRRPPTAAAREACGRAQRAVIAGDGRFVLTAGHGGGVRVRDGRSGAPLALAVDPELPQDLVAIGPTDRVALSLVYGHTVTWSEAEGLVPHHRGPEDTGPIDPVISDSGRVLTFERGGGLVHWDLLRGRSFAAGLAPGEVVLAVAGDGEALVIRRGQHLELRQAGAPPRVLEALGERARASVTFSRGGDRLVVDVDDPADGQDRRAVVHDLRARTTATIPAPVGPLIFSADGEALTAASTPAAITVYRARDGRVLADLDAPALAVALAPDASYIAWIARGDAPVTVARVVTLAGGAPAAPVELRVPGWPRGLAVSPDGDEILVITQESITRWRGREGTAELLDERAYVSHARVHTSADGRHLFFEGYGRIDVHRRAPGAPKVATITPLLTGGYLIQAAGGEVDGSADAPAGAMTWVAGPEGDAMVEGGALAWDRLAEPGLYARLLAE